MPVKQPNSRMCFVCGLENPSGLHLHFYETAPGEVESTYTAPEHFQGYPGVLHGGIVATILDEITGRALMGTDENPRFMYTAKIEVKYRYNVPLGVPLRLVGKALTVKTRTATAWGGVYHPDGRLLAEATALLMNVPADTLAETNLEALGWRIYPDEGNAE
ncbi:MAG: PaaI family thioesterase [Anaerolineales bacterium]